MVDYKDELGYANSRLSGSLVLIEGIPRWVTEVKKSDVYGNDCTIKYNGKSNRSYINNSELPLGYVNSPTSLHYVVRMPSRQYKQGIRTNNLYDWTTRSNYNPATKWFQSAIMGCYPSISDCVEEIEVGELNQLAFHRKFAIGGKGIGSSYSLMHKTDKIGLMFMSDYGEPRFELLDEFAYLEEETQEIFSHGR